MYLFFTQLLNPPTCTFTVFENWKPHVYCFIAIVSDQYPNPESARWSNRDFANYLLHCPSAAIRSELPPINTLEKYLIKHTSRLFTITSRYGDVIETYVRYSQFRTRTYTHALHYTGLSLEICAPHIVYGDASITVKLWTRWYYVLVGNARAECNYTCAFIFFFFSLILIVRARPPFVCFVTRIMRVTYYWIQRSLQRREKFPVNSTVTKYTICKETNELVPHISFMYPFNRWQKYELFFLHTRAKFY